MEFDYIYFTNADGMEFFVCEEPYSIIVPLVTLSKQLDINLSVVLALVDDRFKTEKVFLDDRELLCISDEDAIATIKELKPDLLQHFQLAGYRESLRPSPLVEGSNMSELNFLTPCDIAVKCAGTCRTIYDQLYSIKPGLAETLIQVALLDVKPYLPVASDDSI